MAVPVERMGQADGGCKRLRIRTQRRHVGPRAGPERILEDGNRPRAAGTHVRRPPRENLRRGPSDIPISSFGNRRRSHAAIGGRRAFRRKRRDLHGSNGGDRGRINRQVERRAPGSRHFNQRGGRKRCRASGYVRLPEAKHREARRDFRNQPQADDRVDSQHHQDHRPDPRRNRPGVCVARRPDSVRDSRVHGLDEHPAGRHIASRGAACRFGEHRDGRVGLHRPRSRRRDSRRGRVGAHLAAGRAGIRARRLPGIRHR